MLATFFLTGNKRDSEKLFFGISGFTICEEKIVSRQDYLFQWAVYWVTWQGNTGFKGRSTQAES